MDPRDIHAKAEDARESGDFLKALELTDQAALAYRENKDYLGLSEIQSSRFLIFKHLYRTTQDLVFLILGKHAAESAVDIAEHSGLKESLAIPYQNLGNYFEEIHDHKKASEFFKKAAFYLNKYPNKYHGSPEEITDLQVHQYISEYSAGQKDSLDKAKASLEELEKMNEVPNYQRNVWLSGGHMRMAKILIKDDLTEAKKHLLAAKSIIESDKRLILRSKEWNELSKIII